MQRRHERIDGSLEVRPAFGEQREASRRGAEPPGDGDEVADAGGVTAEEALTIGLADERDVDDERAG